MLKCKSCGYERGYSIADDKFINEDDAKFIKINGNFTIDVYDYYTNIQEVSLYACPKCKTVILED